MHAELAVVPTSLYRIDRRSRVIAVVTQQTMDDPNPNLWPARRLLALFGLALFAASFFCPISHRETSLDGDHESFYSPHFFTWLFSSPATFGLGLIFVALNLTVAVLYFVLVCYPNFPLLTAIRKRWILAPLYTIFSMSLTVANVLVPAMFLTPIGLFLLFFSVIGSGALFWLISVFAVQWIVRSSAATLDRVEAAAHPSSTAV